MPYVNLTNPFDYDDPDDAPYVYIEEGKSVSQEIAEWQKESKENSLRYDERLAAAREIFGSKLIDAAIGYRPEGNGFNDAGVWESGKDVYYARIDGKWYPTTKVTTIYSQHDLNGDSAYVPNTHGVDILRINKDGRRWYIWGGRYMGWTKIDDDLIVRD